MFKKIFLILSILVINSIFYLYFANFDTDQVIVAVIDTGIDSKMMIKENILTGYDFIDFDNSPVDQFGHGTLMIEIITDIAPEVRILPVRFLETKEGCSFISCPLAIFYSIFQGADIINMSFNGEGDWLTELAISFGKHKGVIFVGSTGNSGKNTVDCPAKYKEVLAIGGYLPSLNKYYGNYGSDVDFIAPAEYKGEIGTSISSAYVSGVLAYMKHHFPEKSNFEFERLLFYNSRMININNTYQYPYIDIDKIKAITENDI